MAYRQLQASELTARHASLALERGITGSGVDPEESIDVGSTPMNRVCELAIGAALAALLVLTAAQAIPV